MKWAEVEYSQMSTSILQHERSRSLGSTRSRSGSSSSTDSRAILEQLSIKNLLHRAEAPRPIEYRRCSRVVPCSANPEFRTSSYYSWVIANYNLPVEIRTLYGDAESGPVWTFNRMGMSLDVLQNGTRVYIGGHYGDMYEPDYHIYNDVVVITSGGDTVVCNYSTTVLAPICFHNTTVDETRGCIDIQRRYNGENIVPLVYRLSLIDYSIKKMYD